MVDFLGSCIALVGCSESDADRLIHQQRSPTEEQNPRRMEVIAEGSRGRNNFGYREKALFFRKASARDEGDRRGSTWPLTTISCMVTAHCNPSLHSSPVIRSLTSLFSCRVGRGESVGLVAVLETLPVAVCNRQPPPYAYWRRKMCCEVGGGPYTHTYSYIARF